MKKLILSFALFLGVVGMAEAGGRQDRGWNVTIVTGTAIDIGGSNGLGFATGNIYLKKIILSSGTTTSQGDFLMVFSTPPNTATGAGGGLMPSGLFISTAALTQPLVFLTTTTTAGVGSSLLSQTWNVGECDTCYLEVGPAIPAGTTPTGGFQTSILHIRKSAEASGGANIAAVYWSR